MGHYNAVQRVLYAGVIVAIILQVLTGLAIWKPVQLGGLAGLFGRYPIARDIHLATMFGIVAFVLVHVALVVIHAPGHSPGSVCLYCAELGVVFSGDILLADSTIFTTLFGGTESLERFWRNMAKLR